ncbi:tetratricopeptide repeat protein [Pajaroellobacter abortibovis]|uniref:tetratricopeptide repeat protein n=1 Tax=Pajaroellobacter abortibovis TaxID=1882918 RepID=UPI001FE6B494|nr:tetratricopeptide repeat protein [Pajaroellobacter abortibovis]
MAYKGDGVGAGACARSALELDKNSAEAYNLLGVSSILQGEYHQALHYYRNAIELEEGYFDVLLNTADLLLNRLGKVDEAIDVCDRALAHAESPQEIRDCILLKVDALIAKSDIDEAKKTMAMIPDVPLSDSIYIFLIGRSFYELGDLEKAKPLIEEAARSNTSNGDIQYYLGLLRDDQGDARGATEAFLRTRTLDSSLPAPSWSLSPETFSTLARQAISKLDAVLTQYIREADVFIMDLPGAELIVDGVDPRAPVLVDPSPPVKTNADPPRTRIFIYQRNIERIAASMEEVEEEIGEALEREITTVFLEKESSISVPNKHHIN